MNLRIQKSRLHFIKERIQNFTPLLFILTFFCLSLLVSAIWVIIASLISVEYDVSVNPLQGVSKIELLAVACVIAPLLETWLVQMIPIEMMKRYVRVEVAVVLSALLFGLMHTYSTFYIINMFFVGLVFSTAYVWWAKRSLIHPFWIVCGIHFLKNLLAFIVLSFN